MKLQNVYAKSLKEVLEEDCTVVDYKVHSNEYGEVQTIEVKYRPKDNLDTFSKPPTTPFGRK